MTAKRIPTLVTAAAILAVVGASAVLAKSRRPNPDKYYASRDIRLHIPHPKDTTGWKQNKQYDPEKDKSIVMRLRLKKPDSSDPFDVIMTIQGWDHGMNLTMKKHDGSEVTVSTGSVQQIASIIAENIEKGYKDIKEVKRLRKTRISATVKKGYLFEIRGLPNHGTPLSERMYGFSVNAKTYIMQVVFTTASVKNEAIVKDVDKMIRSMIAWKP